MDTPNEMDGDRRQGPQRAEDRKVAENVTWLAMKVDSFIAWATKVRWLAVFLFGAVVAIASLVNGYAAWAGAQRSSPAQEIAKTNTRLDSVVNAVAQLEHAVKQDRARNDSARAVEMRRAALLLRISCRGLAIEFRDLLDDCREIGANR